VFEANQGNDNVREPHNESVVEVGEAQEFLDCFEVGQHQPDTDSIGLGSVHGDASGSDHTAQELNLLSVEQTLLGFGVQVLLMKVLQDMSDMNPMIFQWVWEDEDVIEVDHYEDISHVSEDVVH